MAARPTVAAPARWRSWWLPALCVAAVLAAYSGRWRPSRDGALYRGVAHSLAQGDGFAFRGEPAALPYPGLPYALAAVEVARGDDAPLRPRAELALMAIVALLSLLAVHRCLGAALGAGTATATTAALALNPTFLQHSAELMTDLPFSLAAWTALAGLEQLERRRGWAWLIVGVAAARVLRPTFWALATAAVVGAQPARRLRVGAVVVGVGVAGLWLSPAASGSYEAAAVSAAAALGAGSMADHAADLLARDLPALLTGVALPAAAGVVLSIVALACVFRLCARRRGWLAFVGASLIAVLVFGSRARYLLPLLPLVIGGVVVAVRDAARGAGAHWVAAGALVAAGVGGNLALLAQQHGGDTTDVPIVAAAEQLRAGLPGDARAIGTEPRILSYLSRRAVFGVRELPEAREPGALAAGLQRRGIRFVVVPVLERDRYGLRELLAEECIALGPAVVVAGHLEARPITTDPRPCASPAGGGGWLPRTAASPRATSP